MNTDLSTQLASMNTVQSRNNIQLAVFKKTHDTESQNLISMLQSAAQGPAALPPGQGLRVDKSA